MATLRQTCAALDEVLRLPPSSARGHAQRLRLAGVLPASQGYPGQISSEHIAAILVAITVGSPLVDDYLNLKPGTGGPTFGKVLAGLVEKPFDLLELQIETLAPWRFSDLPWPRPRRPGNQLLPPAPKPRPAFDREVRIGPEVFIKLAAAIANAPEVRAGRPRLRDRYTRT
ncbi:hypothetical protein A4U53_025700 [Rhizobium ruizarguesonis]|uniref:Uncharacterized protein n=1 Tax=Rhizobium ruizarguesonis TaxID=2081791 RepID=A0ACD5EKQ4_9HYPH